VFTIVYLPMSNVCLANIPAMAPQRRFTHKTFPFHMRFLSCVQFSRCRRTVAQATFPVRRLNATKIFWVVALIVP